jgi:zinc resistance-associated protein
MWKAVVAGTAVLAIAGTSYVYAQRGGGPDGPRRWQPSMEDMRAFGEARLAGLKAGLTLTPEQERNWPAFEQAARELGKLRADRMTSMRDSPPSRDPVERMRQRATALADTGAALKKLADATDPLYKSLDENQKRRFALLSRVTGPRMDGFRGRGDDGPRFHHWGPRRTDGSTPMEMEHSGEHRL